ncbi:hypothetical protein [Streptomyces sp. NPDC060322]|uniref:hypothetical protein n=1 Tax=Streptomyces sp. NPDC060322 TaxID=3347097 RepID=UPI00365C93A4
MATDLKHRPNNNSRSTRVEINPVDQSRVEQKHQREVASRNINVRGVWDRAVDAWLADDGEQLNASGTRSSRNSLPTGTSTANVSSIGWAA